MTVMRQLSCYWRGIILIALLLLTALTWRSGGAQGQPPHLLVIIEQTAVMYAPGGQRIDIPAGTELDACEDGGTLLAYDLGAMAVRIPAPCTERPLFADGFEGGAPMPRPPRRGKT